MTEPSVRVGSAATAFNLPYNAKPPAGNPIVNSEGDLVEVFKKCFRENGVPWIVGVLAMNIYIHFFKLVLISVKTGLYLGPWANVVVDLRVEIALHDILLVVPIVCACPAAWGIGNLH